MFSPTAAGRRVLLVDNDFLTREAVTLTLAGEGYMVATAANGREALEWLRHHGHPDVILLDLAMPGMDGAEFRREQMRDAALGAVPVVVLSAVGDAPRQAAALGAAGCLQKPIETAQLLDAVRKYCRPQPVPQG